MRGINILMKNGENSQYERTGDSQDGWINAVLADEDVQIRRVVVYAS